MTRRLMIAGVAVLVAAQSALALDAVADQISIEQRSRLNAEIAGVPAELRTRFDELYRDWRTTWERPDIRVSSNSKAVKDSDEFRALASLGPKVGEQHSGQRQQEIRAPVITILIKSLHPVVGRILAQARLCEQLP
jgi:hypothetical protein